MWLTLADYQPSTRISGFTKGLRDIDLSPDGHTLAVASRDGTARLYSWPDAQLLHTIEVEPGQSHINIVYSVRFHPTEPILITADRNNKICLWNSHTGLELASAEPTKSRDYSIGFLQSATFSPDGSKIYACLGDDDSGELVSIDLHFWDKTITTLLQPPTPPQ